MEVVRPLTAPAQPIAKPTARVVAWRPPFMRSLPLRIAVLVICGLWTLPTLGLLVTSVRNPIEIQQSGWWDALIHPFQRAVKRVLCHSAVLPRSYRYSFQPRSSKAFTTSRIDSS